MVAGHYVALAAKSNAFQSCIRLALGSRITNPECPSRRGFAVCRSLKFWRRQLRHSASRPGHCIGGSVWFAAVDFAKIFQECEIPHTLPAHRRWSILREKSSVSFSFPLIRRKRWTKAHLLPQNPVVTSLSC